MSERGWGRRPGLAVLASVTVACAGPSHSPAPASTAEVRGQIPGAWPLDITAPATRAWRGAVAADEPIAAQVGAEILEKGGNAVDAAVATAFALAVSYPEAGNLGGGGFLVVRFANGESAALDFRETAPLAAVSDMYLDEEGEVTDQSVTGHLASGVPGSVAGLWELHRRFGSRPWVELIEPAIRLAEEGFVVSEDLANSIADEANRLSRFPASAALFLPGGRPPAPGTVWSNPDLAATLRRIGERGSHGFYRGETADLIVAEMRRSGGLITHEDLQRYQPRWRAPIEFEYRGHRVISMPPPSSGGITLAMIANILEGYDLRSSGWHSPESLHLTAEAMRRAFAFRNQYLGDPDFVDVPQQFLLSEDFAAQQRAGISLSQATPSSAIMTDLTADDDSPSNHTTHVSITDEQGNAVALTTTINFLYGSAVTVEGAGFVLNDEMDDFTAKPGEPNAYGLVQGEANAIEPEKRMLSAMTPTIVIDTYDRPLLVTGARGGPRIITAVFQVMSNVLDYGMELPAALNVPRIHHQHLPDALQYEARGLTSEVVQTLELMGHTVEERSGYVGVAPSILRQGAAWRGMGDARRGGAAAGF